MPYLQIDFDGELSLPELAPALARAYSATMEADEARISVGLRRASAVRCFPEGVRPVIVVTCDIREGRPPARLAELAGEICALVSAAAGRSPDDVVVYFTQHPGFEIYRDGAPSADW